MSTRLGTCSDTEFTPPARFYELFGESTGGASACTIPTNYRFARMEFDSETGLYHTWFRQYDPSQGRWLGVDLLAGDFSDPGSYNRFGYALNDPVIRIDLWGLGPCGSQCTVTIDPETERPICNCPAPDPRGPVISPDGCMNITVDGVPIGNTCDTVVVVLPNCSSDPASASPLTPVVEQNIGEVRDRVDESKSASTTGKLVAAASNFSWWYNQVRNKGPWDYKNYQGSRHAHLQDLGNLNYGATGAALGLPLNVLLRGAGWASLRADPSRSKQLGHWLGGFPHGDDYQDQFMIIQGFYYFHKKCYLLETQ